MSNLDNQLDPAFSIIRKLGGAASLASDLGLNRSAVYFWSYPRDRGGTNGEIPLSNWEKLLQIARRKKVKMKLADLYGKSLP